MSNAELVSYAAIATCVVGMMLVVAGVVATGLFLPGVVVTVLGGALFVAAGALGLEDPSARARAGDEG